jgi:signal transduction histidine kinase
VARLLEIERVRTRIAADLHDDIGASLSQIAILSEVARGRLDGLGHQLGAPLTEIIAISAEVMDSMSDMVWAINPKRDHVSDLVSRARRFAGDMLGAREIALEFRAPEGHPDPILSAEARRQFLLIAKEAVNNVARHSRATKARIEFDLGARSLTLRVHDNGRGFDQNAEPLGNGLANIRRRAAMLDGSVELYAKCGEGTVVIVTAPL